MNIRFLETVVWLAELRNFRMTADRLNMTPAAISGRISAIEQELGIRLFERDTRDVQLTAEGSSFVRGAREIIARYNELISEVVPRDKTEGTVRIGVLPALAMALLPAIMDKLKLDYPAVRVSVTTGSWASILSKLEQRDLDIVLGLKEPQQARHCSKDLCVLGMFWVASKRIAVREGALGKNDLMLHPVISYDIGSLNYHRLVEYMPKNWLDDSVVHYSNSLATTISMVVAGIGISVLPPLVLQNELRSGAVTVLDVAQDYPSMEYSAIYLENPSSPLAPLVATIAGAVARDMCSQYDKVIVSC